MRDASIAQAFYCVLHLANDKVPAALPFAPCVHSRPPPSLSIHGPSVLSPPSPSRLSPPSSSQDLEIVMGEEDEHGAVSSLSVRLPDADGAADANPAAKAKPKKAAAAK